MASRLSPAKAGTTPTCQASRFPGTLNDFREGLVEEDFPQYRRDPVDNTDRVMAVVQQMRSDTNVERAEAAAARAARAAPKTPAAIYPHAVRYMRRLAGVAEDGSRDGDLPELAHELANSKTSEKRACLQNRLTFRSSETGAASSVAPIATKEMLFMYENGVAVAPTLHQLDDLLAGLSAFTCGWRPGTEQGEIIRQRQLDYDNQQSGGTQVTLAEQRALSTKEVHLPVGNWEATQMLKGLSIVLDEFQGAGHPHARGFREFLVGPWQEIVHAVESMSTEDRDRVPHIWARLVREIQLIMGGYLRRVVTAEPATAIPNYAQVRELVLRRQWNLVATIPERYLGPPSPTGASGSQPPSPPAPGEAAARPVTNPTPNNQWLRGYQESGKTLAQLRADAPKDSDNTEVCLSYHLRGQCYANCQRRSTHRALQGAPLRRMNTFVNTHCQPVQTSTPAPAPAGGGGSASGASAPTGGRS